MFPILYDESTITYGQVPTHNGLGVLSDALSCKITEERNGAYELQLTYPSSGLHADDLQERRLIKVKPNFTDSPQLFRIYKISKKMKSSYTVYARHISYDLSGADILTGSASTCADACRILSTSAFTITTDKSVTANFTITEPSSRRSWFGGKSGSLLDTYGTGEYHYDNFDIEFLLHRGVDRGVTVLYGKNLLSLTQDTDATNLATHLIVYWKNEDTGAVVQSSKVATGLTLDVEYVECIDVTSDFIDEPTTSQLNTKAQQLATNSNYVTLKKNIKLDFLQLKTLTDRVDLCDEVTVKYEKFGINIKAKCVKTTWDALLERYESIEIGDIKQSFASTFVGTMAAVEEAQSTANSKVSPTNIRTAWSIDPTSIYVQSGQIHFNAGTFLVDSTNLVIDANGNVKSSSFKSNTSIEFYTTDWTHLLMSLGVYSGVQMMSFYGQTGNTSILNLQADSNGGAITVSALTGNKSVRMSPLFINLRGDNGSAVRMTNTAGGKVEVYNNASTPGKTIDLNGSTGNIECVSLTQTSTRKVKKNIKELTLEEAKKLLKATPVTYDFKDESLGTDKRGFIAEDIGIILPEVVEKDENDEPVGIDYIELIPYLVKLMQEHDNDINKLKEKNNERIHFKY